MGAALLPVAPLPAALLPAALLQARPLPARPRPAAVVLPQPGAVEALPRPEAAVLPQPGAVEALPRPAAVLPQLEVVFQQGAAARLRLEVVEEEPLPTAVARPRLEADPGRKQLVKT
ncbi:MAG: hypothetical protein AMXMBFR82_43530 [Candidatus Hydrogenedentota bacterium]